jgi:hypothetical protein
MNATEAVHRAALIFASESWWKPVIGYIVTNCAKFSGINFTNDEHDCFLGFRKLYTELFDCFIAKKLGLKSSALESAFISAMEANSTEAAAILDMLRNYSDFLFFRQQMIDMGTKIQEETSQRLIAIHKRLADSGTEEATDVATILEEGEDVVLERETAIACEEMRQKLKLSVSEVSHFVAGATSGLTPRRVTDPRRGPADSLRSSPTGAVKGSRSAILKPLAVKK